MVVGYVDDPAWAGGGYWISRTVGGAGPNATGTARWPTPTSRTIQVQALTGAAYYTGTMYFSGTD